MNERTVHYLLDRLEEQREVIASMMRSAADTWDAGFDAHRRELERQAKEPNYAIHRPNPYRRTE